MIDKINETEKVSCINDAALIATKEASVTLAFGTGQWAKAMG